MKFRQQLRLMEQTCTPGPCSKNDEFIDRDATLIHFLERWARELPDKVAYHFVGKHCGIEDAVGYRELNALTDMLAARLAAKYSSAQTAVLLFPQGLEFIIAFLACFKAGIIAVPVSVPTRSRGIDGMEAIVTDCGARLILTTEATRSLTGEQFPGSFLCRELEWMDVACPRLRDEYNRRLKQGAAGTALPTSSPAIAMLQYTSGSTDLPKGVIVSHANLLANQAMIQQGFDSTQDEVIGTWLPLYHDMGLIGAILQTVYLGATCYVMSPSAFSKRPLSWLQMISQYGITGSGCPNFGYLACLNRVSDEDIARLDLSRWRVAFSGAEPVRATTLALFAQRFAAAGFDSRALVPCYGMAEATLFVRAKAPGTEVKNLNADAADLEKNRVTGIADCDNIFQPPPSGTRQVVSCGVSRSDLDVKIVNPETCLSLPENSVGEIWLSGPSIACGYWQQPQESIATFAATIGGQGKRAYLRTGDLGFIRDGELYITGRCKDLLIINGKNIYPNDIEASIECVFDQARISAVAAFHIETQGRERVVVVAESSNRTTDSKPGMDLSRSIEAHIWRVFGVPVEEVVLTRRNTLPRTTSGKLQRNKLKSLYLSGNIERPKKIA